jgi:tetratricopeptide (TPR) repeat protein
MSRRSAVVLSCCISVVLITVAVSTGVAAPVVKDPATAAYLQGERSLKQNDLLSAVIHWEKVLYLKPSSVHTEKLLERVKPKLNADQVKALDLYNSAKLQVKENKLLEAVRTLQAAYALQPKCVAIWDRMVEVANEESRHLTADTSSPVDVIKVSGTSIDKKTSRSRSVDMPGYLMFVEGIEQQRMALFEDASIENEMGEDEPKNLKDVHRKLQGQVNQWASLLKFFDSQQPAIDCDAFAQAYRLVLSSELDGIRTVQAITLQVREDDPDSFKWAQKQLIKLRRDPRMQQRIDRAALAAERELKALCARHKLAKNFSIQVEPQAK